MKLLKKAFVCLIASVLSVSCLSGIYIQPVSADKTSYTQEEAVAWANSQIGKELNYDGRAGGEESELVYFYLDYLGEKFYLHVNAYSMIETTIPYGWIYVYSDFKPGDIAVWKTDYKSSTCETGSCGLAGIITECDGDGFYAVTQGNRGNNQCLCTWFDNSDLECAIRPYFKTAPQSPIGCIDFCEIRENKLYVQGWAFDPNSITLSIAIEITANGKLIFSGYANSYSPDVNEVYTITGYHRFAQSLTLPSPGEYTIVITALDIDGDLDAQLGSVVGTPMTYTIEYIPEGWIDIMDKRFYYKDGEIYKGWLEDNSKWYYMDDETGTMTIGWRRIGGSWYYFMSDGKMLTGMHLEGNDRYYLGSSGAMVTGWNMIWGAWYYFNISGVMQLGWVKVDGKWYYTDPKTGGMKTGWIKVDNKWYFLQSNGEMLTGWYQEDGSWYFLKSTGEMATGWAQTGGKWYFFNANGKMATGWLLDSGKWYYLESSGAMVTGTVKINGKTYNFDSKGVCLNP